VTAFHNPNQEPGTERRLLLAFVLTFLVIAITQPLIMKYAKRSQPPAVSGQPAAPSAPTQAPASPPPPAAATAPTKGQLQSGVRQASSESEIVIENDLYRITFTNRGAQVKSWILKKYTDDNRRPLELVNQLAATQHGFPLSLWTYDENLRTQLNSALYLATSEAGDQREQVAPLAGTREQSSPLRAPAAISFEYSNSDITVRKRFRFDHSYVVKIETLVTRGAAPLQAYPAWPAGFGDQTVAPSYGAARIDWQFGDKIERVAIKKISSGNTLRGPFHWAGTLDQYFAAVFLPDDPDSTAMVTLRNGLDVPKNLDKPDLRETVKVEVLGAAVGNINGATSERLFVGPKAIDVLESIQGTPARGQAGAPSLGGIVNFGFFGIIAKPLFLWLRWTHEHWISNWGWSIVILTIIINVALLPLRVSSMKSMLKQQRVAPQIKSIQEKYKKYSMRDPRRADMQKEIGGLYKKEGINPVGGCFPMLLQIPFLFAFYTMLGIAIELRHAPWLWVRDLSSPDPWHILPIAIIITMFFTQKMTPQTGMDPVQQKMMSVMMPVMLGVISWSLAAGLGLYWAIGNALAIAQQAWMNRTKLGREMREEMEKRARKKK